MSLKTNYKNYVPSESMSGKKQYRRIENANGTVSFEDVTEYSILGDKFGADDINRITRAINYNIVTTNLVSSEWKGTEPALYDLSVAGVTSTNINEILPGVSITAAQMEAFQSANITDNGQTAGVIKLKALGEKPKINIPIRVIVRGDI